MAASISKLEHHIAGVDNRYLVHPLDHWQNVHIVSLIGKDMTDADTLKTLTVLYVEICVLSASMRHIALLQLCCQWALTNHPVLMMKAFATGNTSSKAIYLCIHVAGESWILVALEVDPCRP